MNIEPTRKVTRGYLRGLVGAIVIFVMALVVMGWGLLGLFLESEPVSSDIPMYAAPITVAVALGVLAWILKSQAISILKGNRPSYIWVILIAALAYLIWNVLGMAFGMTVAETWFSPFALLMAIFWPIGLLIFWAIFMRRVMTERATPKWPWEDREERERRGEDDRGETW